MNLKNLLLITVVLLLVALGNWVIEEGVKQVDTRLAPKPEVQQDYYLNNITVTALDKRGHLQHRLQASQLSHFTADTQTQLENPKLLVYKGDKVEWRVTAKQGQINQRQDEVVLKGKVKLVQTTGDGPLRLTTSLLRIEPELGRADTDKAVTLRQGDNRIDAIGMQLEQKGERVLLLSQVRGHYETLAR